jgi:tetratricopeptide (TPR) repeat protein
MVRSTGKRILRLDRYSAPIGLHRARPARAYCVGASSELTTETAERLSEACVMRRTVLTLSVCLSMHCALAGDKPEFGPAPSWVQATDVPTIEGASTDAAVRIILTDSQFNFSASGSEAYFGGLMRVQTSQGLSAVGTLSLPWNPETDTLTVHRLHVIRGNQIIDVLANGQTFTVLRRENSLEYAALNGVLTAVIQPAGLQVGDTIDLAFSIKRSNPVLTGASEWVAGSWPNVPISHLRVRAQWTAPTVMRWKASDSMTGVREKRRGDTTEVTAVLDDPSPLLPPNGAPARYRRGRQIEFSSFKSWAEIAERFAPLYVRAGTLSAQSSLNAEVARIRAAATDPSSRAMAALLLVQDQVRYVFLGMNEGALVPTDADVTWSRRFGDCKGKTALLLALLHALGIEAEPVAVNTLNGDSVKSGLPMIEAFNHVLVRAVIEGKTYWLDGARSGDRRVDELTVPPYQWGLPLVAKSGDLVQMVPTPLPQPTDELAIRIDASHGIPGFAPVHAEAVLRGQPAALLRFSLGNLASSDRDQMLRKFWDKALAFVKADSVAATFDEQTAQEHLTLDGSTRLEWNGQQLDISALGLKLLYNADIERTPGANSDAPFVVTFPTYSRVVETIALPRSQTSFTVEGDDIHRTIAGAEFRRKAYIVSDVLTAEASVRTLVPEIPFAEAEGAKAAVRDVTAATIYLHAPPGYATAVKEDPKSATLIDPGLLVPQTTRSLNPPDPVSAFIRQGNVYLNEHKYDQAISEFDKALELNPRSASAMAGRGMAHLWANELDLARQDLESAAVIDPRNAVVPRGHGMLALIAGRPQDAVMGFTDSLTLEPNNIFTLNWRAEAYAQSGELDKAVRDVADVIGLRPNSVAGYEVRAVFLRQEGRLDESLQEAESVISANPNSARAHVAAAEIYWSSGKEAEAMRSLQRSIEIEPTAQAYVTRAVNYRPKADLAGRRADVEAALTLDPASSPALILLARIQSDAAEYAGAIATLNKAISIHGEAPEALTWRGIVYVKTGQPALAATDFSAARAKTTEAEDLNEMCWDLATSGVALETALGACDAALAKRPYKSSFLDSRGFVLLRLGRYDDAIASYDTALRMGERGMSLYGRGLAKRRKGDKAGSDADFKSAIALDVHVANTYAEYGVKP